MTKTPTSGDRGIRSHARHLRLAGCALALLMPATTVNVPAEPVGPAEGGEPLSEHQREVLESSGPGTAPGTSSSTTEGVESGVNDGGAPLSPHQRQSLRGIDRDGDGRLNQTEYSGYPGAGGTPRAFERADGNGDGYVDTEEFSALQAAIAREKEKSRLR